MTGRGTGQQSGFLALRRRSLPAAMAIALITGAAALWPAATAVAAPAPTLAWTDCGGGFQCATAQVPLDYQNPEGAKISLAVIRLQATDTPHRIGSLFMNPGGPGGSGVRFVRSVGKSLSSQLRARFDIVGFDPRGVSESTPVLCFTSTAEQRAFLSRLPAFPVGEAEERDYIAAYKQYDQLCAARNPNLLRHMSTANAARDMDMLRRAVGDEGLSYIGLSYGTYLGSSYVNLFPDRVRAVVLDGVLEPVEWSTGHGSTGTRLPFSTRLKSDDGAFKTLGEFFDLCDQAGPPKCAFASAENQNDGARGKFTDLMDRLLEHPLIVPTPGGDVRYTYALVVRGVLSLLYSPAGWPGLAATLQDVWQRSDAEGMVALINSLAGAAPPPYNNSGDAFAAIACADSDNPDDPFLWPEAARRADDRAPYFGSAWTYVSMPCASWQAQDPDRYTGPWDRPTANPVLVIGNRFDPATRYESAQALSHLLASSRLLTLDGWGHTAFGKSACVEQAEVAYLVDRQLPPEGSVCKPTQLPFGPITEEEQTQQRSAMEAQLVSLPILYGASV
jgi:pimeloyl-ACP methyl ester carboxylesterase